VWPVLVAAGVLVGGANLAAYAANGHPLLLGRSNHESDATKVTNLHKGPALALRTSRTSAPLQVNGTKVVKHLNADKIDGLDATALGVPAIRYKLKPGTTSVFLKVKQTGTFLVGADIAMDSTETATCALFVDRAPFQNSAVWYGPVVGTVAVASGTGVVTIGPRDATILTCDHPVASLATANVKSHLTLSRFSSVINRRVIENPNPPSPLRPAPTQR